LAIQNQSEEILFNYVESLKDTMHNLCNTLSHDMHKKLKEFGGTLKKTKAENKKSVKGVSKAYFNSTKKADKLRKAHKEGQEHNEATLLAIEREKADKTLYKFYVEFATKSYKRDIVRTFKQIDGILKKKVNLKTNQKSKSGLKSLKPWKKESSPSKLQREEEKADSSQQALEHGECTKKILKKVQFEENLNYRPKEERKVTLDEEDDTDDEDSPLKSPDNSDEEVTIIDQITKSCVLDPKSVSKALEPDSEPTPHKDYLTRRFSQVLGDDPEIMVQFQNYITQN